MAETYNLDLRATGRGKRSESHRPWVVLSLDVAARVDFLPF